jgi:hypothetical protein
MMNDVLKIYSLSERNDKYEGCTSDSIYGTSNCISRTIKMIDHLIFKTISFLLQKIVCKLDMMADECFSVERRYIYICPTWWHTTFLEQDKRKLWQGTLGPKNIWIATLGTYPGRLSDLLLLYVTKSGIYKYSVSQHWSIRLPSCLVCKRFSVKGTRLF